MDHSESPRDKPTRMTLDQFKQFHCEITTTDLRPATLREYDHAFDHATRAIGTDTLVSSLTIAHVARIKASMADRGLCYATIYKTIGSLRAAMNRAKRFNLIHDNPFTELSMHEPDAKTARIFSRDEIDSLVASAPDLWLKAFVKFAFTSGLRLGEIEHLRWTDVDLDGGTVTVVKRGAGSFTVNSETYPDSPVEREGAGVVPDDSNPG